MADLIDRRTAIDALKDRYYKYGRFAKLVELVWVIENLPSAQPDCTDCIQNGGDFDCDHVHCHKGARLDGYTEQIRWERDIAIQQLKDLGYGLGEKVRTEMSVPQRWIPVSERLPEEGVSVLISVGGMYSAEGCLRWDKDWNQFRWSAIQDKEVVDAWMPLPEPYKGE